MAPKRPKNDLEKVSTRDLLRSIKRNLREKIRESEATASRKPKKHKE